MKGFYLIILVFAGALVSCSSEDKPDDGWNTDEGSDFQVVDQNFEGDIFKNSDHLAILEELNICEMDLGDTLTPYAKCKPENFEIIPISDSKSVKDAFIVYTKSSILLKGFDLPLPLRHIMVFERENGKLVRANGFRGEIVTLKPSNGSYKDIVISLYVKDDDTVFDCLYKWQNGKYSFESVEGLDWGEGLKPLKANVKDSMSAEIYTTIMSKNLVF